MTASERRPLSLGSSSFSALRQASEIYVDKTAMVHELAQERRKILLTRPRRFGKSLLISTFESLFRHGLRDFQGLAIENLWKDENTYRVVRLDFSRVRDFSSAEEFEQCLDEYFTDKMTLEKIASPIPGQEGLRAFSNWLSTQPMNSVVLLIDEYDAPLTACLGEKDRNADFDRVWCKLSRFYAAIKENEGVLRFLFVAGIMKYSNANILSELNILSDISLLPRYGALLGFTHEEVKAHFGCHLTHAAEVLEADQHDLFWELFSYYGDYCFEETAGIRVFSPWSLLNFLNNPGNGFRHYWIDSAGDPAILCHYLKDQSLLEPQECFRPKFASFAELAAWTFRQEGLSDIALLTSSGYLTIKSVDSDYFLLYYPNKEIEDAFASLCRKELLSGKSMGETGAFFLGGDIFSGKAAEVIRKLNCLFSAIEPRRYPVTDEDFCSSCAELFLSLGFGIQTSRISCSVPGLSLIETVTEHLHWMFAIAFMPAEGASDAAAEQLLQEALEEVRERLKGYADIYGRKLIRIGAVFSEEARQVVRFEEI